jgi:hypothetical protein
MLDAARLSQFSVPTSELHVGLGGNSEPRRWAQFTATWMGLTEGCHYARVPVAGGTEIWFRDDVAEHVRFLNGGKAGGALYAILFSNKVVKVGRSERPYKRARVLSGQADGFGISTSLIWISRPHLRPISTERKLLDWCAANGRRVSGTNGASEYFHVDFDAAVAEGGRVIAEAMATEAA